MNWTSFFIGWFAGVVSYAVIAVTALRPPRLPVFIKSGNYRGQHYAIFKDSKGFYPVVNGMTVVGRYPYRDSHYVTIQGAIDEAEGTIAGELGQ